MRSFLLMILGLSLFSLSACQVKDPYLSRARNELFTIKVDQIRTTGLDYSVYALQHINLAQTAMTFARNNLALKGEAGCPSLVVLADRAEKREVVLSYGSNCVQGNSISGGRIRVGLIGEERIEIDYSPIDAQKAIETKVVACEGASPNCKTLQFTNRKPQKISYRTTRPFTAYFKGNSSDSVAENASGMVKNEKREMYIDLTSSQDGMDHYRVSYNAELSLEQILNQDGYRADERQEQGLVFSGEYLVDASGNTSLNLEDLNLMASGPKKIFNSKSKRNPLVKDRNRFVNLRLSSTVKKDEVLSPVVYSGACPVPTGEFYIVTYVNSGSREDKFDKQKLKVSPNILADEKNERRLELPFCSDRSLRFFDSLIPYAAIFLK